MNSLIKTTIKRPVTVCVLVIILLSVGVLATLDMSTNLLPDIAMPMMGISVVYPGASAQSVEDGVTSVLEHALQTVPGITELETISYDNVSVAILTFDYGTDIDEKIDVVEDTLKTVSFPDGCYRPSYLKIDMNGTATATIAVFDNQNDSDLLTQQANALATKLRAIEGVGSVEVFGAVTNQIKITALNGLDITSLLIVQALQNENLDIPLGTVMQDGTTVSVRNASDATSRLQVMQLPVKVQLGGSALTSLSALKNGVSTYASCTMQQFSDYVQKAIDAKSVMEEMEGKTADELAERQNSLSAVKSLMALVRENSSQTLKLMWHSIDVNLVQNEEFVNMTEDDLSALANQMNMSVDTLKWLQEGAKDGTLKEDWNKLVAFRAIFPTVDFNGDGVLDGDDITYEQFATLFQDGGSVVVPKVDSNGNQMQDEQGNLLYETKIYDGLDTLHSEEKHQTETDAGVVCDKKTFSHDDATKVCEFADSVNTVAYANIVDAVREAEEKQSSGETVDLPIISDQQFAALFVNSTQGDDFAALVSPQVIHVIRQENFNNGEGSVVDVLTKSKQAHVDADGNAVFRNGKTFEKDSDGKVTVNGLGLFVNNFGRLVDADNNLVDENGARLTLSDEEIANNYFSYGDYVVYTDQELLDLYAALNTDADFGVTPTLDTVRFLRICNFSEDTQNLIVPLAYVAHEVSVYRPEESYAEYNGLPACTVKVYAVSDANTTKVVQNVRKVVEKDFAQNALLLDDKAEFITDSITNVLSSIIVGGVLAVLVIYLFVRKIGSSLVVSVTMPLSVLTALLGLWAMNISLNMVSLGGLAVGIGMLVDNSIVVLESISKHRDAGESVFDSCFAGTKEVAGSLLASTLTNVCVFFPILFSKGLTREIFYDLVWSVLFAIVMSLVVAVTVIPSLYHLIYKNSPRPKYKKVNGQRVAVGTFEQCEPRAATEQAVADKCGKKCKRKTIRKGKSPAQSLNKMENGYGKVLSKVLSKRVSVCVTALVLFCSSVGLVFTTGSEFLPSVDKGLIEINVAFDGNTSLEKIKQAGVTCSDAIRNDFDEGLQYVSLTVGKQGLLASNPTIVLRVQIDSSVVKTENAVQKIRTLLNNQNLGEKSLSVTAVDGVVAEVTGGMAGQSVTLLSDDMELLASVASQVATELERVEGIVAVRDNTAQKTPQISFSFDKEQCAKRGVDYQNAVLMLRVGLSGYTAATINVDGEKQDVTVQFAPQSQTGADVLTEIVVGFDDDGAVKLKDVLKKSADGNLYVTESVVSKIDKIDGKYVTTIDIESFGTDTGTMSKRVAAAVNEVLAQYPSVTYQDGGVSSYLTDAFNGLIVSLIAAFLLLYGVMACQFESLLKPFVVIMSIPFSFTGGFLALAITGTTLNVVSFVGIIMLMGVIVNGAIVMIDKIDLLIKQGETPQQAVIDGCKSRLRPILMTTLTTVLALIPLALGFGRGGTLMQPMGIVVIGGLVLGTLVTLVLIPCFYCIVKRISFKNYGANGDGNGCDDNCKSNNETDSVGAVGSNQRQSDAQNTEEIVERQESDAVIAKNG